MTSNGEKQSATTCINPRISLGFARDAFDKLSISAYGLDTVQAPQFWQRGSVFSLPPSKDVATLSNGPRKRLNFVGRLFTRESLRGPRRQTATQSEALRCEPLRNESGVEHAVLVPSSHADHPVVVIDLASIDVVDFLAAMLLTSEFGRAVVRDRLLHARAPPTNCQRGLIFIASGDNTLPASLLCGFFGFSLSGSRLCILRFVLRGNQSQGQKGKHRRKTQRSE